MLLVAPAADPVDFAILGAGAIGSIMGAHLAHAGHRVVMLARGARAQQIERDGLRTTGLSGLSQRVAVLTDPSQLRAAAVLVIATKTYGTDAALAPLHAAKIDVALSIQNGMMKNEQLSACLGRAAVLGCLANTSGELLSGGVALFTRNANIFVGELDGADSARAQRIAGTLDAAGVRARAVQNIQSLEWCKFASWVGMMVLSVTLRAETWKCALDPGGALLLVRLVREIGSLAQAQGVTLSDQSTLPVATLCQGTEQQGVEVVQRFGAELKISAPEHRMSTLQDLLAGRRLEVEETLGYAARVARECGVTLPLLDSFYPLVAALDRTRS